VAVFECAGQCCVVGFFDTLALRATLTAPQTNGTCDALANSQSDYVAIVGSGIREFDGS
jgi:hypothetical protein